MKIELNIEQFETIIDCIKIAHLSKEDSDKLINHLLKERDNESLFHFNEHIIGAQGAASTTCEENDTKYQLWLIGTGNRAKTILAIKSIFNLDLDIAKNLLDNCPVKLYEEIFGLDICLNYKKELEKHGAKCEIKNQLEQK